MKQVAIILFGLIISAFGMKTDEWKPVILVADKVAVSMPGEIKETEDGGRKVKMAGLPDSTLLSAMVLNMGDFGLTEEMLGQQLEEASFKEQFKQGVTQGGNGHVNAESSGKYKDKYVYYQFDFDAEIEGQRKRLVMRAVFYKTYAVSLNYIPGRNGADTAVRDKFFNSLKLTE